MVVHHQLAMFRFEFLQFFLLFRTQFRGNGPLRFFHHRPDPLRRFNPDRLELRRGRINDRRDFRRLFGRQIEGAAQMFSHPFIHLAGVRRSEEMVPEMERPKKARHRPGEEDEKEGESQLPFQGVVHSENSVWIAESAMAYSFACGMLSVAFSANCR